MNQIVLAALLFLALQFGAQAEVIWESVTQSVTDSQSITVDVDKSSIRQRDGLRQGWFRVNVIPPTLATNGKEYSSAVQMHLANCKHGETSMLNVIAYKEFDLQGDIVQRIQLDRSSAILQFTEPSPESVRRALLDQLCGVKLK